MRKFVLVILILFSYQEMNAQADEDTSGTKSIFTETAESKFEILSKKPFVFKTVESTFKPVSIQLEKFDTRGYFADITTTTKKWTGVEAQERNIRIKIKAFDDPSKTIIEINKNCDDIDLQPHLYKTIKYGCCGHENHYEIFDYENKQILKAIIK